ncbi:MAG: 23S rRNA (pseudouridine(1915)-N(3))-methyltransferase RlmH [Bacteroidales bacterium]|nr:23S rRNA (pseudouridine(1915)-N(3))-methyltransferase RlmH [Bacteroidales bacterium]MDD3861201.1 23S rRNA (pseudouridine(1915)-N(3))-methyltransferase RlmH [Bacteroidales bacterium]
MNICLLAVGKTDFNFVNTGTEEYFKRVKRYVNFDFRVIKDIKNSKNIDNSLQKQLEGEKIISNITNNDIIVLLDENGKEMNSKIFSGFIQKQMNNSVKNLVFIIGGAYGFSEEVYKRANYKISLSQMTFSHQIIRLIFAEQLYRAFSIINNEPYHHE